VARSNTAATWKDVDFYFFFSNLKSQISNLKFAKAPMPPEGPPPPRAAITFFLRVPPTAETFALLLPLSFVATSWSLIQRSTATPMIAFHLFFKVPNL
jgi:hypothetical protein